MPQTTREFRKLTTELSTIRQEMRSLRSLLIGIVGEDREGRYRPEFVRDILRATHEKPDRVFRGANAFLAELRRV